MFSCFSLRNETTNTNNKMNAITKAASILSQQQRSMDKSVSPKECFKWWHTEVRKVARGYYNNEHVLETKRNVLSALALSL